jgi:hypothetical protein
MAELLRAETERRARVEAVLDNERKASSEKLAVSEGLKSNNRALLDPSRATLEKHQEAAKNDLEARQKAVGEPVRPLRKSLEKVDGKLGDIEKSRIGAYAALNQQLKSLVGCGTGGARGRGVWRDRAGGEEDARLAGGRARVDVSEPPRTEHGCTTGCVEPPCRRAVTR